MINFFTSKQISVIIYDNVIRYIIDSTKLNTIYIPGLNRGTEVRYYLRDEIYNIIISELERNFLDKEDLVELMNLDNLAIKTRVISKNYNYYY